MADNWIKMRNNLRDDPAVIAIAANLSLDQDTVVGKLHRVWAWADQQTVDGNAPSVTGLWLDHHTECAGLFEAMKKERWIGATKQGIYFPNFERHNGQSAKQRALTAKRVRALRDRNCNALNVTKTLTDKRRLDKSIKKDLNTDPPVASAAGHAEGKTKKELAPRTPPTGPHAELIAHFTAQWESKYGTKYLFAAKDGVAASRILVGAAGDLTRAKRIIDLYLACAEPFIADKRHPLTLLLSQINRFTSAKPADPKPYAPED